MDVALGCFGVSRLAMTLKMLRLPILMLSLSKHGARHGL
jgi:hypothetical protein